MDDKAIKILFKRYWSTSGWTNNWLRKDELEYAKLAGVMFDSPELSHEDIIQNIIQIIPKIDFKEISEQFISSLSTRKLDLRSALGSYIVGSHLLEHLFLGEESYCLYCGAHSKKSEKQDLNVLNFERFKWGGVRHLDPLYIAFDLNQFIKTEKIIPSPEDYDILKKIFETIKALPSEAKVRDLEKALSKVLKSNKQEREVLIQILGYCSILSSKEYPGFLREFVPLMERELPNHYKNDWSFPVCWWNGNIGLNEEAIKIIFPNVL